MTQALPSWIEALQMPACYDHPVDRVELIETHASWVLLAGAFAYKIKKPVDFGFLDFSTLDKRRHFCREELRLNRRTAPDLYLEVVAIGGEPEAPRLGGAPVLDYAVKMRRFPQECQFDRLLAAGRLEAAQLEGFAAQLVAIHATLPRVDLDSTYGTPESILAPVRQNFDQLRSLVAGEPACQRLDELERWSLERFALLHPVLTRRRAEGFVRECHGDVHLANIAWLQDQAVLFDCIEFNENFRWIDLVNDYAFLVMDLDDRGEDALGWRFLNRYLRDGGDYAGLELLRFYQVYRALVRAKVAFFKLGQETVTAEKNRDLQRAEGYLHLAAGYTRHRATPLIITCGLSGSGKSRFVSLLAPRLGAITLHSDVERKRLHGLSAEASSRSPVGGGIYREADHQATYRQLEQLAATVVQAGFPAIVDATFLLREQRARLLRLAAGLRVPFVILDCQVPEAELRRRVEQRSAQGRAVSEAGLAVLDRQLEQAEPLSGAELACTLRVTPTTSVEEIVTRLGDLPPN